MCYIRIEFRKRVEFRIGMGITDLGQLGKLFP
jgi:hypothetical protein